MIMQDKIVEDHCVDHWSLGHEQSYQTWRKAKLADARTRDFLPAIRLGDLANPTESERSELAKRCESANLALYEAGAANRDEGKTRADLRSFAGALGLEIAERHRSAGEHGIVALRVSDAERQRGYIPYSRRAMNWHTDGYYNGPDNQIRAMVLHCVIPANDGGLNQFLDPEIAYIRLRDLDPDHIRALMHPEAMTIPENRESDGALRPTSVGPVFSIGPEGKLAMRYTARTRSISWRDDARTKRAVAALTDILNSDDPLIITARLKPGQGILCNNVLHNRTGFDPDTKQQSDRLVFRIRFHNRVKGS
jgi:alpha-ketoglutarate-dependent taurine dioxygenase